MARYLGPVCRLCRREGIKLFLKGTKCNTDKCPVAKRAFAPGQHGRAKIKLSNYGLQLREKQKAKRIYGLMEGQFRNYFKKAKRLKGITGHVLLQFLERRLDNVIFRLCFAASRQEARQIVQHGHIKINGKGVNIPSYLVKANEVIEVKGKEPMLKKMHETIELVKERGVSKWLEADFKGLKGKVIKLPEREDVGFPIQEQLIVELYSK